MRLTMQLNNEQQGHLAAQTIWRTAKAHLSAGRRMVLELRPQTRSTAQNAAFVSIHVNFQKINTRHVAAMHVVVQRFHVRTGRVSQHAEMQGMV